MDGRICDEGQRNSVTFNGTDELCQSSGKTGHGQEIHTPAAGCKAVVDSLFVSIFPGKEDSQASAGHEG